jgi:glutathionylspermidine synthase
MNVNSKETPQYAGKPLDISLSPIILKKEDAQLIEKTLTESLKQVEDFTHSISKDRSLLKLLNLPEDLDLSPTPLGLHIPFARFDFLFDGKNVSALELNTDGTSGYNVTEWIADKAHLKEEENPNFKLSEKLLRAIQEHNSKTSEIALVDFENLGTSWEQHDLVERWKPFFSGTHFSNPQFKSWKDGATCYRRVLSWQLRSQPEKVKAFLDDWKNKKITVVGGWSSDVGMSKAWPALLKPACFPETVLLNENALKTIIDEKDAWIIKGALSYSGNAVFRGMDLKEEKWGLCVRQAMSETLQGRHWIGQRRLEIPKVENKPYELGLYFLNGKPSGYMCRWGSSKSISETSDEVLRPVRIIS